MPSANLSSNVSPVNAKDVAEEFGENIKLIINGGSQKLGLSQLL